MAKWYGKVGYVVTDETEPGVYEPTFIERSYYGETYRNTRMLQNSGEINDSVNIGNQISIVADPYAHNHIYDMRYAEFQGAKWKVTSVDVQQHRLILTLGGLFNG